MDVLQKAIELSWIFCYNTEERRPLHPKVKKYLDMVVNRCKEENIELVLFWIPSPDSWRREKTKFQ